MQCKGPRCEEFQGQARSQERADGIAKARRPQGFQGQTDLAGARDESAFPASSLLRAVSCLHLNQSRFFEFTKSDISPSRSSRLEHKADYSAMPANLKATSFWTMMAWAILHFPLVRATADQPGIATFATAESSNRHPAATSDPRPSLTGTARDEMHGGEQPSAPQPSPSTRPPQRLPAPHQQSAPVLAPEGLAVPETATDDSILMHRLDAEGDAGAFTLPLPRFPAGVMRASIFQPFDAGGTNGSDTSRFDIPETGANNRRDLGVGFDQYSPPEFEGGLIIFGSDIAMKIGGYVKADFIYDFDPIDSTDTFVTTEIPVNAPPRTNARYHARQTRLSFDTRWASNNQVVRIFVEGDFFGNGDQLRLRHAYGESNSILVGRTWTTFTDVAAAPATLDFEGSVSAVNRRQAQARWTESFLHEDISVALAVEDTRFLIEVPMGVNAESRSPSPDFVGRVRLKRDWGQFQIAQLYRIVGLQPENDQVYETDAWGFNLTGVVLLTRSNKAYYQVVFGEGIGSYRGLPDAAPTIRGTLELLPLFGWMVGVTHEWSENLSSNVTYAENRLENEEFQSRMDVHKTSYLAANLIWNPLDRVRVGFEFLHGLRENADGQLGTANRAQVAFIFDLP